MTTRSFIVVLFVLGAGLAYGDDYPKCEVKKESKISFSSEQATDSLSITISGTPCHEGSLNISIASNDDHVLYHYEAPFSKHVIASWEDPALLADDIERFMKRILDQDSIGSTSDLPNWLPEADYYEENYQILQISREDYEKLRQNGWITFTHPIHYEGHRVIAFDPDRRRSIIVSEGTL